MLRISDVEPTTALDGLFTNGKVASGVSPTRLVAEWFNAVQTELVNVVEGAGLTIDPDNSAQVFAAIKIISESLIPTAPVTSVNSKTGAVTLGAEDVGAYPETGGQLDGSLNTTGQITEAGQRVYSPNNEPDILSSIAGSTAGAVGSYCMLRNTTLSSTISPGDVVDGSRLVYSGVTAYGGDNGGDWARITATGSVTGSWRCMGYVINTDRHYGVSLFLRVA